MSHRGRSADKAAHRGAIIRLLVPFFPEGMTFSGLQEALFIESRPMEDDELEFHLAYLEQSGYVSVEREVRRRHKPRILKATALRKAVDLLDQRISEDPGVVL